MRERERDHKPKAKHDVLCDTHYKSQISTNEHNFIKTQLIFIVVLLTSNQHDVTKQL